jgi:hypothetical protein
MSILAHGIFSSSYLTSITQNDLHVLKGDIFLNWHFVKVERDLIRASLQNQISHASVCLRSSSLSIEEQGEISISNYLF